jgi:energy-coupling factor transporter ATP-binding protein EcfA2
MSKREAAQTQHKRTKRVSNGTPIRSSLRAATVRKELDVSERPTAPVELLIENVRCFAGRHEIPIRPLTVLVGENSSGKSTLLAALSVVCDSRFPLNPEFNKPPYNLGNFQTIATHKSGVVFSTRAFSLGFRGEADAGARSVEATYVWHHRRTALSRLRVERPKNAVELKLHQAADTYQIGVRQTPTSDWSSEEFRMRASLPRSSRLPDDWMRLYLSQFSKPERKLADALRVKTLLDDLALTSAISLAPIRTKPIRTYDDIAEDYSPDGDHIPYVLARILRGDADSMDRGILLKSLKSFGEESGLFTGIEIRNLGDRPGDPFQVMINVSARPANLIDVGYGVSQALPVIVQSILAADENILLLQQPEVHLHPKAQAALGSFFVDMHSQSGKHFVVETHSDYILDRIRMEIADGKLPSDAFLILYLERHGTETTVYPITVDSLGNLLGVPPTYREFFLREEMNLLTRGG